MPKGIASKLLFVPALCTVLLLAGCESDGGLTEEPAFTAEEIRLDAEGSEDRNIGKDLIRYMFRNCPSPGYELTEKDRNRAAAEFGRDNLAAIERQFVDTTRFCGSIRAIKVRNKRITMWSDLEVDDEAAGEAFCMIVRGSDVADQTPFHTLLDETGNQITICGTRNAYR